MDQAIAKKRNKLAVQIRKSCISGLINQARTPLYALKEVLRQETPSKQFIITLLDQTLSQAPFQQPKSFLPALVNALYYVEWQLIKPTRQPFILKQLFGQLSQQSTQCRLNTVICYGNLLVSDSQTLRQNLLDLGLLKVLNSVINTYPASDQFIEQAAILLKHFAIGAELACSRLTDYFQCVSSIIFIAAEACSQNNCLSHLGFAHQYLASCADLSSLNSCEWVYQYSGAVMQAIFEQRVSGLGAKAWHNFYNALIDTGQQFRQFFRQKGLIQFQ